MSQADVPVHPPESKPKPPKPAKARPFNVPWSIGDGLFLLSGVIILPLAVYFVLAVVIKFGHLPSSVHGFFFGDQPINAIVDYAITVTVELALLRWILHKYQLGWRALGLAKFHFWRATWLIIGFYFLFSVLIVGLFALLQALVPQINIDQAQATGFEHAHGSIELAAGFIVIVLIAPILEEMFFRGFLFPALTKRFQLIGGAIASSAIFGLLHFQANISIYTFVLGLFLCFLYYKLKSVIPGMVLHMLNNLIAYLIIFKII